MSTSHEKALAITENPLKSMHWTQVDKMKKERPEEYKKWVYKSGKLKVPGKTQKQVKEENSAESARRRADPNDILNFKYTTDTSHAPPPKKDRWGWAGRVGQAHLRNQKAEHEKGYREDYR